MTETVQIAVYVAIASLVTQLLVIWIQYYFKEKEKCKAGSRNDRLELRQCLSEFFCLIGATDYLPQGDSDDDEKMRKEWSEKYYALFWRMESYIPESQKELLKKLDELTDCVFIDVFSKNDKCKNRQELHRDVFDLTRRYISEF